MRVLAGAGLVAAALACATTAPPQGKSDEPLVSSDTPAGTPVPERGELPVHELPLPQLAGAPVVRVASLVEPRVGKASRDGVTLLHAMLALGEEAECLVRADRLDVGQAFHHAWEEMARRPTLANRRIGALHLVSPAGVPVLWLAVRVLQGGEETSTLNLAITNVGERGVFCTLEGRDVGPGFRQLVSTLVRSLVQPAAAPVERHYHWVTRSDGFRGMVESVRRPRKDGVNVDLSFGAMLRTRSVALATLDDVAIEVSGSQGELVTWRVLRTVDGRLVRDVALAPTAEGHAVLRRERAGLPPQDLGAGVPVTGTVVREHLRRIAAAPAEAPVTLLRYFPGLDEEALAEETIIPGEAVDGRRRFTSELRTGTRAARVDYTVDAMGNTYAATLTMDGASLVLDPVLDDGF